MKIPKLAADGIIQDQILFGLNERGKPLVDIFGKKYFEIYKRTKNRRIKKKQIKRCPMLKVKLEIEKCLGLSYQNKTPKIYVGGKEIYEEGD